MTSLSYTVPVEASELKKVLKDIQAEEMTWEKEKVLLYVKSIDNCPCVEYKSHTGTFTILLLKVTK